jgi:Protein of unknown function (DUF1653)
MRMREVYNHYKGADYEFIMVALPVGDRDAVWDVEELEEVARYHEDTHDLRMFRNEAADLFIESEVPMVVYRSITFEGETAVAKGLFPDKDIRVGEGLKIRIYGKTYAREVDDFFSWVKHEGKWQPRFEATGR